MNFREIIVASLVAGLSVAGSTRGGTLLAYYGDGTDVDAAALGNLANVVSVTASNLANTGFEGGTNITRTSWGSAGATPAGPTAGSAAGSEWFLARANTVQGTPGTATDYFGFTVTAAAGRSLDLANLTFDRSVATNQDAGGIISNCEVFASVDGGAFSSVASGSPISVTPTYTFLRPAVTETIDLSSVTGAKSAEIRIALGDNSGANSKGTFLQGIQLNGDLAVSPAQFKIDINSGGSPTEAGWTGLDAGTGNATTGGVTFTVFSADGHRDRGTPNDLTRDFVFDDGAGEAVGLSFGGAGDLAPGIWDVDLYSNDSTGQPGNQIVGYRTNTTERIVGNAVTPKSAVPAINFQFESDGTSAYDVFVRENSNNRSRLNAVQLTYLSSLTPAKDTLVRYDLDAGTSDESASNTTSQTDGVDVLAPHLSATPITSGPGWGREDPGNGNNANVGNGSGPESQTDDGNTWWARGSTLPNDIDSTHFASFTVTPEHHSLLDLSDGVLGVKMGATDRNAAGSLEFGVTLFTSLDGFASDLDTALMVVDQNLEDPLYVTSYFDLSSLGIVSEPLEFRLFFDDNSGLGDKHPLLDTVFLLGIVMVPEPSTLALSTWAFVALGCYVARRKRT